MSETPASPEDWVGFMAEQAGAEPPRLAHAPGPPPGPCPQCGKAEWKVQQITTYGTAWRCCGCQHEVLPRLGRPTSADAAALNAKLWTQA